MSRKSTHYGAQHFADAVTFTDVTLPNGTVTNAMVASGAAIDASKVVHQFPVSRQLYSPTTTIAAATELLHIVRGATGTVVEVEAAVVTKATGTDRTVNVDIKKSTGGGAFATILTGTILFDDDSTNLTAVAGTISSASLVAGDLLQAVVTVAGSDANQALGLVVTLTIYETPT